MKIFYFVLYAIALFFLFVRVAMADSNNKLREISQVVIDIIFMGLLFADKLFY